MAHLNGLRQQLIWAEAALANSSIKSHIRTAAQSGLANLFNRRRDEIDGTLKLVSDNGASELVWDQLARHSWRCSQLFNECLALLGSALIRSDSSNKNDICVLADALLNELDKNIPKMSWTGVTLLAEVTFFTETTGLIRLPFPDMGIWNLPIAVHELGHFVGVRIVDETGHHPFEAFLAEQQQRNLTKPLGDQVLPAQLENHLKELFSDLFAVFSIGPAYACSAILLRFSPADASATEDSLTHPSHSKRVHFILEALERLSKIEKGHPYEVTKTMVKNLWEANFVNAGHRETLDQQDVEFLDYVLSQLWKIVKDFLWSARYLGWDRAVDLRNRMPTDDSALRLQGDETIADVLNAFWIWRLSLRTETAQIVQRANSRAFELCHEIIRRPRSQVGISEHRI